MRGFEFVARSCAGDRFGGGPPFGDGVADAPWYERIPDYVHRRACRHECGPVTCPALANDNHHVGRDRLGVLRIARPVTRHGRR